MEREDSSPIEFEMCCGKQRCPTIRLENDSAMLHAPSPELEWTSDEHGARAGIRMNVDQARELHERLGAWLKNQSGG
jgi:hypothetical protein